mmetsp:Transcript_25241/g.84865  ORF Transcript_25241/g.84865 Transcript_25241/m.84865 type:complete len:204 (-) Transcript_25241:67-678(-)
MTWPPSARPACARPAWPTCTETALWPCAKTAWLPCCGARPPCCGARRGPGAVCGTGAWRGAVCGKGTCSGAPCGGCGDACAECDGACDDEWDDDARSLACSSSRRASSICSRFNSTSRQRCRSAASAASSVDRESSPRMAAAPGSDADEWPRRWYRGPSPLRAAGFRRAGFRCLARRYRPARVGANTRRGPATAGSGVRCSSK